MPDEAERADADLCNGQVGAQIRRLELESNIQEKLCSSCKKKAVTSWFLGRMCWERYANKFFEVM